MKDEKGESHSKDDVIEIPLGKLLKPFKKNPWAVVSLLLAVAVIVLIVLLVNGGSSGGSKVGKEQVSASLLSFVKSQGSADVSIVSIGEEKGLYKAVLLYQGQEMPVYVTYDGSYLITNPISLTGDNTNTNTNAQVDSNKRVEIDAGDSPSKGSKTAKVTVVEFSDFSCPFCVAASGDNEALNAYMKQRDTTWEPIVTNLIKDYVDTGKVRLVVKYTYGHGGGNPAQLVAWCLNEQNLYWKFYPKAFATYDLNSQTQAVEDLDKMKEVARSVGANMPRLQTCLDSKKFDSKLQSEQAEGSAAGVQGTPAFFVNGKLVSGAVSYLEFKQLVEQELNS